MRKTHFFIDFLSRPCTTRTAGIFHYTILADFCQVKNYVKLCDKKSQKMFAISSKSGILIVYQGKRSAPSQHSEKLEKS